MPRILYQSIRLKHYEALRVTNELRRSPAKLIARYSQWMVIKNQNGESINLFHMDALFSAVR
jgi:hypothetical protein